MTFEPLRHPIVHEEPLRLTDVDSWQEHIPFAFFAVSVLRPAVLVELGTWKGDSYCGFCQAVHALELPTRAYAVDTWEGDEHTGAYGPAVLEELREHHDLRYGSFSSLLQRRFDDAAPSFADGSVDLLHIDGAHGYDAVAHDLETWLPKLSARGVILLHDTHVHEPEFGVWRLWNEVEPTYPSFAFSHGHGLGVLAVGVETDERFTTFLRGARVDSVASAFFAALGGRAKAVGQTRRARAGAELAGKQAEAAEREALRALDAREEAEGEVARRLAEANQAQAELVRSSTENDRLRLEQRRLELAVREREADIEDVVGSASWRLTSPLRRAKRGAQRARRLQWRAKMAVNARSAPALAPPREAPPIPPADLRFRPLVSVVTPVYNTDPAWLGRCVDSVRAQGYAHWELRLTDDGSTSDSTLEYLRSLDSDPGIKVSFGQGNQGIAAATNRALEAAAGEFVAFLDHDDELHPDALLACVDLLNRRPDTDVVYTDEDKVDLRGRHSETFLKPDWSPELFRGVMYVGHLLLVRRSVVESAGGLDSTFDGVQDFELMLRVSEQTSRIEHVPRVLYHWRKLPGSVAQSVDAKDGVSELQAEAVSRHLRRREIPAIARPNPSFPHRALLEPRTRADWPRVSVIVPTKDAPQHLGRCLRSLYGRSTYPNFGVVLVDTGTRNRDALRLFDEYPVDVLPFDGVFNFSRVNNLAVEHADGEVLVFLNNDTEVETPGWLEALVSLAEQDDVGAVGPLLLYPNGTVQHAGVVLGLRGTADHIMRGFPRDVDGYAGSLSCAREVSAITGACLAMRRGLFGEIGGFDEHYGTHYQDVDLCLRLRDYGRRNVFTPRATLLHDEGVTRGSRYDHLDRALFLDRWGRTISAGDPYYNPGLSLSGADYRVAA
jgi:O-antigen biosynthesis protein